MTIIYPVPAKLQGILPYGVRIFVGIEMLLCIYYSEEAVTQYNIATRRAWMIRANLGQGAGMQVVDSMSWISPLANPVRRNRTCS